MGSECILKCSLRPSKKILEIILVMIWNTDIPVAHGELDMLGAVNITK